MKRAFGLIPFLGVILLAAPAEAAVRKCSANPLSTAPIIDKVMIIVDGQVLGPNPGRGEPPNSASAAFDAIPQETLWRIEVTCLEYDYESRTVQSSVIAVVTKEGAARLARQYLRELADLQEAYRREHGRYASDENQLRFFVRRTPLPLTITVTTSGWAASIEAARETCSVEGLPGGGSGEIRCVAETS